MSRDEANFSSADEQISVTASSGDTLTPRAMLSGISKDVRKRWLIVGTLGVAAVALLATFASKTAQHTKAAYVAPASSIDTTPKGLSAQKDWKSQTGADMRVLQANLTTSSAEQKELLAQVSALRQEVSQLRTSSSGPALAPINGPIDFNLPPPPTPPSSLIPAAPRAPEVGYGPPPSIGAVSALAPVIDSQRSAARAFIPQDAGGTAVESEATRQTELIPNARSGFLPAGSFAAATLISGVEAFTGATAQTQPQPVVIRINANAILPNAAHYQIKGCHVLASVWGDMSSERVFGRLATLTCVDAKNRLVLSEEVEGNLIDSDGKNGIRGALQDRQGAKLARSLLAGFAQGMATAFGAAQNTVTTSALGATSAFSGTDATKAAGYQGASSAAQSLAQFYMKQAEATMPIIAVDAGRNLSILFTKSTQLKFETTDNYKARPPSVIKAAKPVSGSAPTPAAQNAY